MWYVKPKDELYHHGIKGQKWGVRRFQNEDGSVTAAGAERYYVGGKKAMGSLGNKNRDNKTDKHTSNVDEKVSKYLFETDDYNIKKRDKRVDTVYKNLSDDTKKDLMAKRKNTKKTYQEWDKLDDTNAETYPGGIEQYRKDYDTKRKEAAKTEAQYRKALEAEGRRLLGRYADMPRPKSAGRYGNKAYKDIASDIDLIMFEIEQGHRR